VKILGRTRNWLRYEVLPVAQTRLARQLPGQKQIWFLLGWSGASAMCAACFGAPRIRCLALERLLDTPRLRNSISSERLQHALTELARYLFRGQGASLFGGNRITLTV